MYKLKGERSVLGRGDRLDIRVIDDGVSREHAAVEREGGKMVLVDLEVDQRGVLERPARPPPGSDRRRQDRDRFDDNPEVHLPGPGRRALPEAAVRVGAARRADLDVQPALLHGPAEHGAAVRQPPREVPGAAVHRHRPLQEGRRRARPPGWRRGAGRRGARVDEHHPGRGRAGALRRPRSSPIICRDREGGARALGERLRAAIAGKTFEHAGKPIPVTVSIGAAVAGDLKERRP